VSRKKIQSASDKTLINELMEWIDDNIVSEDVSVNRLAEISGYTTCYINRVFKKNAGTTPGKYIREKKLQLAINDMVFNEKRVSDVSFKYGFNSIQGFIKAFKKTYCTTPGNFIRHKK